MDFNEELLEKLASNFSEDELAEMLEEVELEDEAEKLASMFTEEELDELIKEAEAEEEYEGDEYEKIASAYYELGQIMAQGFNNEMEKEASKAEKALDAIRAVGSTAKGYGKRVLDKIRSTRPAQLAEGSVKRYRKHRSGYTVPRKKAPHASGGGYTVTPAHEVAGKGRMDSAKATYESLTDSGKSLAKRMAAGAGGVGALGTAGAAHMALRDKGKEKKSAADEVYLALSVLDEHGLL